MDAVVLQLERRVSPKDVMATIHHL